MIDVKYGDAQGLLFSSPFMNNPVLYNIFPEIIRKRDFFSFKSEDNNLWAILSGKSLWVCIGALHMEGAVSQINEIWDNLKNMDIELFAAPPATAKAFHREALKYGRLCKENGNLEAWCCKSPDCLTSVRGRMKKAGAGDAKALSQFMTGFFKEFHGIEAKAPEYILQEKLSQGEFYIWEDRGKAVSMAAVTCKFRGYARVNYVYTEKEFRNKGYGKMLTETLCRKLLDEDFYPVLYARDGNQSANKAYRAAGFEKYGNISIYLVEGQNGSGL